MQNIVFILSVIMVAIQGVEQILGAGTGPDKKAAVIKFITELVAKLKINVPAIIMDNLGTIIDLLVALYNAIGPFIKKS